jgi:hypothetical protein
MPVTTTLISPLGLVESWVNSMIARSTRFQLSFAAVG